MNKIATLDKKIIIGKIGKVSEKLEIILNQKIKTFLGLE